MTRFLGIALLSIGMSTVGFALDLPDVAPELDPGSAVSALALLSGSVLVLRARVKR